MSFFFRYKACKLEDGNTIYRPLIPFNLSWNDKSLDTFGVLDSGSDSSIIPLEIAKFLNLKLNRETKIFGLDKNFIIVKEAKINFTIGNDRENYTFPIKVHVPINDIPINTIIGRQDIFDNFEITFNQAQKKIRFKKINK